MDVDKILQSMTVEQKASLCVGMNFWMTQNYPEYEIPSLFLSDGPHGLRKQDVELSDHLGLNDSKTSVCYPTASAVACSWDRELLEMMGDYLGQEANQMNVDMLLGPGVNIKRSPLCGRNFEYYSEDPYLTGQLAASFIKGVQKNGVSACVKHFAANNQETRRKAVDAVVDERTLREIYLPAFEAAVHEADTYAVMSSYNKVNGTYTQEHPTLLTKILRGEWGFKGMVVSDWGAMDQIAPSVKAGLTIQMPGDDGSAAKKIIKAVEDGELLVDELDSAVKTLLYTIEKTREKTNSTLTKKDYHNGAQKIASESIVLLKNEDKILPISSKTKVAVIGEMAAVPRFQGGGSSHVNPYELNNAIDQMKKECCDIQYAKGYKDEHTTKELVDEALSVAKNADVVVIFTGLPDSYESESYDRDSMEMPEDHNKLIYEISKVNPNVVVVLANGSVISMPWIDDVKGIVECYLAGEACGIAVSDILFGKVNPSGKLAETFIKQIEDNPSYLNFPGEVDKVEYKEGIFVGYRYYDKKKIKPNFAFGHGLSYTTFEYSNLEVDKTTLKDTDTLKVTFKVKNTGERFGKEVAQLYVKNTDKINIRPIKELKEFAKIGLEPGEEKTIAFELAKRSFAYFDSVLGDWHVNSGEYEICVGAASDDIRLQQTVTVYETEFVRRKVTRNTLLLDLLDGGKLEKALQPTFDEIKPYLPYGLDKIDFNGDRQSLSILKNMTLNSLQGYVGRHLSDDKLNALIDKLNKVEI